MAGASTRALLLRSFLPLTVTAVFLMGIISPILHQGRSRDLAPVLSTLWVLTSAVAVTLLVLWTAHRIGTWIDRAEEARRQALEEMGKALAAQARSEAHLRAVMDTVADGIITITEQGIIKSFNQGARRIFGYSSEEVLGRGISLLIPARDWDCRDAQEVEGKRKDGRTVPLEMAVGKVEDGGEQLFAVSFHDLTARKGAEEALRFARDAAETSNRAKSQFLANMSHELRTPLTAIIGYSEIMQEEARENGLDNLLPDLEQVHAQSKHLLSLINDLLDMSKIEAGKVQLYLETVAVADILRELANTVGPLVARNANTLVVEAKDGLGTMHTDVTRLRQCLLNLLSNACKFTENGTIGLSVNREDSWLTFRVSDTGIGMTEEQLSKLFQVFEQADLSTTRKYGGTGLGLAITRRLCQMMGCTIAVESVKEQGTTFTLRLPAEVSQPQPSPTLPEKSTSVPALTGAPTVLVVDDDPIVREMLSRVLVREGFQVITAATGEDCLHLAKTVHPRAITLDVMMPGMDGWAVLSALKADQDLADIPVVMLTIVEDKNLGYALGASDYLTKPLDRNRLVTALKKWCSVPRERQALVAEDDPATRDLLRRTLEKDGWVVTEATNGREALARMASVPPAVILLDLMMPEMDGFEFLTELRQHADWRKIPVLVITAKELSEEDRLFLNGSLLLSGCVKHVLQKGTFSFDELLGQVRDLVSRAG
jgi:PAS domain S-box-containing protein